MAEQRTKLRFNCQYVVIIMLQCSGSESASGSDIRRGRTRQGREVCINGAWSNGEVSTLVVVVMGLIGDGCDIGIDRRRGRTTLRCSGCAKWTCGMPFAIGCGARMAGQGGIFFQVLNFEL